tara:strand:- start:3277 stop:3999 length:723 start_codon:yes stop_codon:yes gene_type:complete
MADIFKNKENRSILKNEIEDLLSGINHDEFSGLNADTQILEETKMESQYDFDKMDLEFNEKAKEITDSLFEYYVELGILEKNNYIKHKKELDTINVSNIFFQVKTLKITIQTIMTEITSGNTHPRLIEVMGQLQDKFKTLTQTQANYMLFLEDSYKKINSETPVNPNNTLNNTNKEGEFFISVGTKAVIESLPDSKKYEDSDSQLISPSNKSELMKEKNVVVEADKKDLDSDFIDVTDII